MMKKTNRKFDAGDVVRLSHPMYGDYVGKLAVIVKVHGGFTPAYTVRLPRGVQFMVDELTVEGVTLDELRAAIGDESNPSWRVIIDSLPEADDEARGMFQRAVRAAEEEEYQEALREAEEECKLSQLSSESLLLAVVPGAACGVVLAAVLALAAVGKLTTFGIVLGFIALIVATYLIGRVLVPTLIIGNSETHEARARVEELKKNRKER